MTNSDDRLKNMWSQQREFSRLYYDVGEMDNDTRDAKTRELALALHHEVSKLVSAVNFRGHRERSDPPDRDQILYEAVDAIRYGMAICNLWDFDDVDFVTAWQDKDNYLNEVHRLSQVTWTGEPVFIWDIDDVLAEFRSDFANWVQQTKNIPVNDESDEYFFIEQLAKSGYSSLGLYDEFIRDRGICRLRVTGAVDVVNELYDSGAWIHIVTARPRDNLICRYDTYHWLRNIGIKYHAIDFTGEKLAFVTRTEYSVKGKIAACIDDGPNHITSYLAHDFKCLMPVKPYNSTVRHDKRLHRYSSDEQLKKLVYDIMSDTLG